MSSLKLSCIVPTHNRSKFLRRLLQFYQRFSPGYSFLVLDSSGAAEADENRRVIEDAGRTLQVNYLHCDMNVTDKCSHGLGLVRTPYVVFCADDDYLFPEAVWRSVEFLDREPQYLSAMGQSSQIRVKFPHWCTLHLGYSIEQDSALERCVQLSNSWFSNFYAVHRTDVLNELVRKTASHTNSGLSMHVSEMLLSQLSVLRGKVKVLPFLYSVVEVHGANSGKTTRTGIIPEAEVWYQRFKNVLADELTQTGADREEVEQFIDRAYGHFRLPDVTRRRRRRAPAEKVRSIFRKMSDLTFECLGVEHSARSAVKRLLLPKDTAACRPSWQAAVQLIRTYPHGMPKAS